MRVTKPKPKTMQFPFLALALVVSTAASSSPDPLGDINKLPWSRADEKVQPATSARELLVRVGVDQSHLLQFTDGKPLNRDEEETLLKILFRLPGFPLHKLEQWRQTAVDWTQVIAEPDTFRVEVFHLTGRVTSFRSIPLPAEIAARWQFDSYYQVSFRLDSQPHPVTLCTREIPQVWLEKLDPNQVDQRASALGLLLKLGEPTANGSELVFAAPRIAWHPDRIDDALGIDASHVLLGRLDMDVGTFDSVQDKRGLVSQDRECFYQLLAAAGKAHQRDLTGRTPGDFDLAPMLNDYRNQRGRLVALTGNALRAVKISVDDDDIRQRFDIDHYFEINMFVDQRVQVKESPDDPNAVTYSTYPVIVCVRQLPEGMPEGEDINETVRIPAFFFKLYAYQSEFTSAIKPRRRQISPLLVGRQPQWIRYERPVNPMMGVVFGVFFVLALAGTCYGIWRFSRGDEQFRRSTLSRQYDLPAGQSLDDLDIEADAEPDFSNLRDSDETGA